jgi:hypothetical protein
MKERTLQRKRWAMVFYELDIISNYIFQKYISDDVELVGLQDVMNEARKKFKKKVVSKEQLLYYREFFQRTFTFPTVALVLNKEPTKYEIKIDDSSMFSMKIVNVNLQTENITFKSIYELDEMRKSGHLIIHEKSLL